VRRRRPHAFGSFADILQRPRPCEWYVGFLVLRLPTIRPNLRVTNLMIGGCLSAPGRGIQFLGAFRPGGVPAGSAFLVISKCAKLSKMTPMPRMKNPSPSLLRPETFAKIDTPRGSSRVRRPATSANRLASWPLTCAIANVTPLKKSDRIVLETAARLFAQTRNGEPVTPSLANQLLSALRMLGLSGGAGIAVNGSGGDGDGLADKAAKYFT
jgi:hypothetical protein